ncbi:MAG: hypothetical protein JW828_03315 [Sedimentisphaerales bacterium]|nr:hypothetical protein [Sedimentisphaerales bacterium]
MKARGFLLFLIGLWSLYARPLNLFQYIGCAVAALGFYLYFENLKREIINAIRKKTDLTEGGKGIGEQR